jgi:hypothetical protein
MAWHLTASQLEGTDRPEGHGPGYDRHVLIGAVVTIHPDATPAGWGDEPFTELDDMPRRTLVTDVASSEENYPLGSVEAGGWYWDPRDLKLL